MPHEIDVNLIRTNIRRADSKRLKQMRYNSEEPLYSVIRRMIDMTDTNRMELGQMMEEFRRSSESWKKKYDELAKEFDDYKKRLHGTMEQFIKQ